MRLLNKYFILRHGRAKSNKNGFVSSWPEKVENPLTREGKKQIEKIVPKLKQEKIDLIFSSDILRCKETARIIAKRLGFKINFDKRLREIDFGIFNGKSIEAWRGYFKNRAEKFRKRAPDAENYRDIKKRIASFIKEVDKKFKNKNILIVSHGDVLIILQGLVRELSEKEMIHQWGNLRIKTGEYKKL